MIIERKIWTEYHPNGKVWITGEIGIIGDMWKHLYNYRIEFDGYKNQPVCRLGKWTKHFDNGQLAWTIEYDDHGYEAGSEYPHYRKDGTIIN